MCFLIFGLDGAIWTIWRPMCLYAATNREKTTSLPESRTKVLRKPLEAREVLTEVYHQRRSVMKKQRRAPRSGWIGQRSSCHRIRATMAWGRGQISP